MARRERQLLDWLCARMPASVTPDGLTALSSAAAVLVLASYVGARFAPAFLWLASIGFALNWLGDSLDGSLARYRRIERPSYGYFLDHTVDALNNLMMMVGLGLGGFVRMDVALFALIGYYLLCIYVFITNHLSGVFRLSFLGCGPTELRIGLVVLNTAAFAFGPHAGQIAGGALSAYDLVVLATGVTFVALFVSHLVAGVRELRGPRGIEASIAAPLEAHVPRPQSASTKASSALK